MIIKILTTLILTSTAFKIHNNYLSIDLPPAPSSYDYRSLNCVTKIKNQGPICDNCWAFSAISTLESHFCLKTGILVTLSEQQLIDCNRNDLFGSWGCFGGVQSSAYRYINENGGIESDENYPYEVDNSQFKNFSCKFNKSRVITTVSGYQRIQAKNEEYLKKVVAHLGPVSASLNGGLESFKKYSGGIYSDDNCVAGKSHAVEIIGYGSENGTDYWICKNSWSKFWGVNGYLYIKRGVDMCGITGYLVFPILEGERVVH